MVQYDDENGMTHYKILMDTRNGMMRKVMNPYRYSNGYEDSMTMMII